MTDNILQPIQDSQHADLLDTFESALQSGKFISIEGGALPVAIDANGDIHHGSFDVATYRANGEIISNADKPLDISAFDVALRLASYAQSNGAQASLSLGVWDTDGVPVEQRKIFSDRLIANQDLEALPTAYKRAAIEVFGSRREATNFLSQIKILPQSQYEHSITNRWRKIREKIKKTQDVDAWAREYFFKTGQIFLEAWEDGIKYSFISTPHTRQDYAYIDVKHASDKIQSEGALPIALAEQTLCGPIAGGRMNEMRKKARAESALAKQNGVFTINIQDMIVDTDSLQKIARGVFFQELGAEADIDRSAAYVFIPHISNSGQIIQLPEVRKQESFEEAFEIARSRVSQTARLEDVTVYGEGKKEPTRSVEWAAQLAARARFSWRNAL